MPNSTVTKIGGWIGGVLPEIRLGRRLRSYGGFYLENGKPKLQLEFGSDIREGAWTSGLINIVLIGKKFKKTNKAKGVG